MEVAREDPTAAVTVDLESQTVEAAEYREPFEIDPFAKECLLNGWDDVARTLRHQDAITAYESHRPTWLPKVPSPLREG
jgi:3-isopropylmalate/(R)-2-methylmalate dehydratase small subunit